MTKSATKKKGAMAALRAQSTTLPSTPIDGPSEPQTPRSKEEPDGISRQSLLPAKRPPEDDRAESPMSTTSSASEPPLAQKVKLNGTSHAHNTPSEARRAPSPAPTPAAPAAPPSPQEPKPSSAAGPPPAEPPTSPPRSWVSRSLTRGIPYADYFLASSVSCSSYADNAAKIPERQI